MLVNVVHVLDKLVLHLLFQVIALASFAMGVKPDRGLWQNKRVLKMESAREFSFPQFQFAIATDQIIRRAVMF